MEKTFTIKIWDGVNIITENETIFCEGAKDIWRIFGWDVENDPNARECASLIFRELYCFGNADLTAMNHGKKLLLEVVPCKD